MFIEASFLLAAKLLKCSRILELSSYVFQNVNHAFPYYKPIV